MNDTILTAIISGVVILLGAFLTTRATINNYMHGGSQKDLATAAGQYADAAGKMADLNRESSELNMKLQEQLERANDKNTELEAALGVAKAMIAALEKQLTDDEERRKGLIMVYQSQIDGLKKDLLEAARRIEDQSIKIEQLLTKQYQLTENFAGVARDNKKKDAQILICLRWIEAARNIMVEGKIIPPPLEMTI